MYSIIDNAQWHHLQRPVLSHQSVEMVAPCTYSKHTWEDLLNVPLSKRRLMKQFETGQWSRTQR